LAPPRATSTESKDLGHELSWWYRYASGVSGPRRLGILGGTFDPVHVGHLVAAVNARHELSLDRVLLVVANEPWQKVGTRPVSPAADRLALVEAAVEDVEGLEASGIEIERGGPSYTADTVSELAMAYPGTGLYLIVGADAAAALDSWERLDEVRSKVVLVVVNRPGTTIYDSAKSSPLQGWDYRMVEVPALEISSTELRDRVAAGRPLDFLVPMPAIRQIREHGLYGVTR
jgi:nicotinate-nucleotide adenylyltransferase